MSDKSLAESYPDLLAGNDDPLMEQLVADLAAGYRSVPPPASMSRGPWAMSSDFSRAGPRSSDPPPSLDRPTDLGAQNSKLKTQDSKPISRLRRAALIGLAAAAVIVGAAQALDSLVNLGKPTNATPPYVLTGGFRHTGPNLRSLGFPELLFIGTQIDQRSGAERWPVVKALDQFGTFSGVTASATPLCSNQDSYWKDLLCGLPTFNWEHARYRSRYLVFVHKDLMNVNGKLGDRMTAQETQLYNKYVRVPSSGYAASILATVHSIAQDGARFFPLVSIGGYLQTTTDVTTGADFVHEPVGTSAPGQTWFTGDNYLGFPFETVHSALLSGKVTDPSMSRTLVADVNAESNIITALICHADGRKPASVCNRPAIKQILQRVK